MTLLSDPQAARQPFRHAAAIYDSDEGFLAAVVPFVLEGVAGGEPVIVALNTTQQRVLASVIGQPQGVCLLVQGDHYAHPLSALRATEALFKGYLRAGHARVRLVGDLPRETHSTWRGWGRYEALCNHHFADLAVSALCTYDTRDTSQDVLADVPRVHALLAVTGGEHLPSPDYVEPEVYLHRWSRTASDPMEAGEPQIVMMDPQPSGGRRAIALAAGTAGLEPDGLVCAVSEVLTNARLHGRPPVTLRGWSVPGRVLVTVSDAGPGPSDPFTGLLPPDADSIHGRGLWIAHLLCATLAISAGADGCVVRLVGTAEPSSPAQ